MGAAGLDDILPGSGLSSCVSRASSEVELPADSLKCHLRTLV